MTDEISRITEKIITEEKNKENEESNIKLQKLDSEDIYSKNSDPYSKDTPLSPQIQPLEPVTVKLQANQEICVCNDSTAKLQSNQKLHQWYTLEDNLISLINGHFSLIMETGESGMGKSFNTMKIMERIIPNSYARCSCHVSPLEFYNQLYINRDKRVIVFDDIDNVTNKTIISLLKSACEVEQVRQISWLTTSPSFLKLKIPSNFTLNAGIVLIFNESINIKEFKPIMSRGVTIPFQFTFEEKIREFENTSFIDKEVIEYVKNYCTSATENLSIRTMIILSNKKNGGADWEDTARVLFKADPHKVLLIKMLEENNNKKVTEICKEWCNKTNKSEKTFYNYKKELEKKEIQMKNVSKSLTLLEKIEES